MWRGESPFCDEKRAIFSAVKEWEMGRRKPERPTRVLLKVIEREPKAVKRALEIAEPLRLNDPCL